MGRSDRDTTPAPANAGKPTAKRTKARGDTQDPGNAVTSGSTAGAATKPDLTRNQRLVFDALMRAKGPMTAYAILDELRNEGLKAPLQVYRALDKLMAIGHVHRLETLNAFVVCSHPSCSEHELIAFTICQECDRVTEITDAGLTAELAKVARAERFKLRRATIELSGQCRACIDETAENQSA